MLTMFPVGGGFSNCLLVSIRQFLFQTAHPLSIESVVALVGGVGADRYAPKKATKDGVEFVCTAQRPKHDRKLAQHL